jgi:polysaccharide export outer membrane protein
MKALHRHLLVHLFLSVSLVLLACGVAHRLQAAETVPATGTASAEGADAAVSGGTPDDYVIQVDDLLTVDDGKPRSELTATQKYRVSGDGTIKLIYLDRVTAAGLTVRQLEEQLEKLYDPRFFKNLTINVEVATKTFSVMGEVRIPGIKNLVTEISILHAIAVAGGFTDYAKEGKVIVLRKEKGEPKSYEINCNDLLKARGREDFIIKANDIIWVPRGMF